MFAEAWGLSRDIDFWKRGKFSSGPYDGVFRFALHSFSGGLPF